MSFEEQFITITFLFILLFILIILRVVINKIRGGNFEEHFGLSEGEPMKSEYDSISI